MSVTYALSAAVLVSAITQQLGVLTMPLLQLLQNRLECGQRRRRRLLAQRESLAQRLGGASVTRGPIDVAADGGRPSAGDGRSSVRQPEADLGSSEETVFLPSAAERELGMLASRHRL